MTNSAKEKEAALEHDLKQALLRYAYHLLKEEAKFPYEELRSPETTVAMYDMTDALVKLTKAELYKVVYKLNS
jgi:hypothetical protein